MLEIHLPQLKKYQNISGIAGIIGFLLGTVISGIGFLTFDWHCPFGNGLLQILAFSVLIGIICAVVLGNFVAFLLIRIAKYRQVTSKTLQKEGDLDGNRNIRS